MLWRRASVLIIVAWAVCCATGCIMQPGKYTFEFKNNFKVVHPDAVGKSEGFRLLGIIPMTEPTWTEALSDLHAKFPMEKGKAQTMINELREESVDYWILYSVPRRTVRGLIVEVLDAAGAPGKGRVLSSGTLKKGDIVTLPKVKVTVEPHKPPAKPEAAPKSDSP